MPKTQTALAATEPTGEDAARDDPPHWVSLASLLEGRIERDLDATVRRRIDDAFKGVLDDDGAGVLKPWSGVGSNILGRLVLVRRYASVDGRRCGVVEHRHRPGGVDVGGSLTVCRDPSGDWMVEDLRWWSAAETQSRSLDDAPGGDTASGSWQTLSDALAAPEPGEAEPRGGGWSGIPE